MFLSWFILQYNHAAIPGWGALIALLVFLLGFFAASYLALRDIARSICWALAWTAGSFVVSAIINVCIFGLGFTHI